MDTFAQTNSKVGNNFSRFCVESASPRAQHIPYIVTYRVDLQIGLHLNFKNSGNNFVYMRMRMIELGVIMTVEILDGVVRTRIKRWNCGANYLRVLSISPNTKLT